MHCLHASVARLRRVRAMAALVLAFAAAAAAIRSPDRPSARIPANDAGTLVQDLGGQIGRSERGD